MRAAVYARLSRPKDKQELGANISDQQRTGLELAERRGWDLVPGPTDGTFTDNGRGAYKDDAKRPQWQAMLAANPDVIVVRDVERLGRHPRDLVAMMDAKVKVVAWLNDEDADVNWDAPLVNPDSDEFQQQTVGARGYSRKISVKVKRKVRNKAAAGAWPHGGTRAFGYHDHCCADCTPGTIRPEERDVILELAERWLAGESLMALCRDLAARGIQTPAGKPWQYARLRAMLSGPRIAGIRTYHGVETKGQWEAIVPDDLHRRLTIAAAESAKTRTTPRAAYELTGLIRCGACETTMYGLQQTIKGARRARYVCRGDDGCGQGIAVAPTNEIVANAAFLSILAPEIKNAEQQRRDLAALGTERDDLEQQIKDLDAACWVERKLPRDRWAVVSAELTAKLDAATEQIKNLRAALTAERDLPRTAEDLRQRWAAAADDPRERNRLLRAGVDHVVIHPATKVGRFDPRRVDVHLTNGAVLRPGADAPQVA